MWRVADSNVPFRGMAITVDFSGNGLTDLERRFGGDVASGFFHAARKPAHRQVDR
jgi:hypothetical protein